MIPVRTSVRGPKPPVATILIVVTCALVFLFQLGLEPEDLDAFVMSFGLVPARMWSTLATTPGAFDAWLVPIFSSMFLHGGWGHLLGNMLFLFVFGRSLESNLGALRFAGLYFGGGFAAAFLQALVAPSATVPMIGASGAIAAVLGAYFVLFPTSWVTVVIPIFVFPFFFQLPSLLFLGVWFFQQLFSGAAWALSPLAAKAGGVAWWAHVGGFVAGAALGAVTRARRAPPDGRVVAYLRP